MYAKTPKYGGPQGSQQNKNHGTKLKNKMHLKIYEFVKLFKTDVIIKFHANYCKLNDTVRAKKKVAANRKVTANK